MSVDIASFVNEGLGHSSYVVDLGDGTALVIDPARVPAAASILQRAGHPDIAVLRGGFTGWSAIEGHAATVGS